MANAKHRRTGYPQDTSSVESLLIIKSVYHLVVVSIDSYAKGSDNAQLVLELKGGLTTMSHSTLKN